MRAQGRTASTLPDAGQIRFCSGDRGPLSRRSFRAVGLFEEPSNPTWRTSISGFAAPRAGLPGGYVPDAVCRHHGSATFGRWSPRVVRLIARNQVFLIARHYPGELILRWLWPILVAQVFWGVLALRHGCGIAWLRGKTEGSARFRERSRRASVAVAGFELASSMRKRAADLASCSRESGFDAYWKTLLPSGEPGIGEVSDCQRPDHRRHRDLSVRGRDRGVPGCLSRYGIDAVVVDNASTDGTCEVVREPRSARSSPIRRIAGLPPP